MTNRDRIIDYVERRFQESGKAEWPTVREVSKALKIRQSVVEEEANDGICISYYLVSFKVPLGDHFVELIDEPEVLRLGR